MSEQQSPGPILVDSWKEQNPLGAFSTEPQEALPAAEPTITAAPAPGPVASSRAVSLLLGLAGLIVVAVVTVTILIATRDAPGQARVDDVSNGVSAETADVPVGSTGPLAETAIRPEPATTPAAGEESQTVPATLPDSPTLRLAETPNARVPVRQADERPATGAAAARAAAPLTEFPRPPAALVPPDIRPMATNPPPVPAAALPEVPVAARVDKVADSPPPASPSPISSAAAASATSARTAVESVLKRYATAFSALDVGAAKSVWPTVNERGLARAFGSVQEQHVDLEACEVWVTGTTAVASCEGRTSYTPRVGNRTPRSEPRSWTFYLERDDEEWSITSVDTR